MQYAIEVNGRTRHVSIHRADGRFMVRLDGRESTIDAVRVDAHTMSVLIGTSSHEATMATDAVSGQCTATADGVPMAVLLDARRRLGRRDDGEEGTGPQRIVAPMPGKVVRVLVGIGDSVHSRQSLVVIEAMKMENELGASRPGAVAEVHVGEGQSVDAGALLLVVRPV